MRIDVDRARGAPEMSSRGKVRTGPRRRGFSRFERRRGGSPLGTMREGHSCYGARVGNLRFMSGNNYSYVTSRDGTGGVDATTARSKFGEELSRAR